MSTNKRQEIIIAAAALMHSRGYESTKLADILEAAQIGKGQFYHYFGSKHELGLAVLDHLFVKWNQRLMEGILSSGKDPEIKINEMFDWVIAQHRRNEAKCGCVFGNLAVEMSEHDEAFRQKLAFVFETWINKVRPVLAAMILPGQADPGEVDKMAQSIVAMIEGAILLMKSKQDLSILVNTTDQIKFLIQCFVQKQKHSLGIDMPMQN